MSIEPPGSAVVPAPGFDKDEFLAAMRGIAPAGLMNLALAHALGGEPVHLCDFDAASVPTELRSATLPLGAPGSCAVVMRGATPLPNFADDPATVLPLLEELRTKFPGTAYRFASEPAPPNGSSVPAAGYRVDIAQPGNTAKPTELEVVCSVTGTSLSRVAGYAVLAFLLGRPEPLARVAAHFSAGPADSAAMVSSAPALGRPVLH